MPSRRKQIRLGRDGASASVGTLFFVYESQLINRDWLSSGWSMSALPPEADIRQSIEHVCQGAFPCRGSCRVTH